MRSVNVNMGKGRLEAFSDGVIAIIITIMVLELKVPAKPDLEALSKVWPVFINYVMSFIYVGIYWNNHHHMFHIVRSINGAVLWANLHLLFWLSMVPFVSSWMGENPFSVVWPMALYGFVLLMNAVAYSILVAVLIKHEGENSALAIALGKDWKGKLSLICYIVAIAFAWVNTYISFGLYVAVACIWFIPDRRIEKKIADDQV
ncbi:TMEM175 family protein [Mucilaginibacter sp.]|uniref:TMEM175 family protein n=1 Tax=Mucilaginibacter sp. TaxID=1882438 RepID=UPI00262EF6A8|nr:TMEM175 family protein [Mucilaginibacter sp.]MDB4927226.1 hypothetical protein [Mucilaginibacter sp.]